VQRIGLESLAVVLFGCARERARPAEIDDDRENDDNKRPDAHLNVHIDEEEALDRFINDPDAGEEQQEGLEQSGEVFDLAVAIGVLKVGGAAGEAHGEQGDHRRDQIEGGMGGLGQNAHTAGHQAGDDLESGEKEGGDDGGERHPVLFMFSPGPCHDAFPPAA